MVVLDVDYVMCPGSSWCALVKVLEAKGCGLDSRATGAAFVLLVRNELKSE